jgi:hypothetical protein
MSPPTFGLDSALQAANEAVNAKVGRSLSDVEIIILKGAWERLDYDQIAAQNQYATSYVSNDIAPKLWRLLTDALGEKVKKSNFKAALKRYWEMELNGAAMATTPSAELNRAAASNGHPVSGGGAVGQAPVIPPANGSTAATVTDLVIDENYIERPPVETVCYETIVKPGSLLRIKAPKYMGKTSLVNQIVSVAASHQYRSVNLSFELADRRKHFVDLNQFLRWFCLNISRELGLPGELEEYWDEEGMGAKVSCTTYFEEYLLAEDDRPLVLCLDDVDLLFPYPDLYEDFFGLLRSWYEKARSRRAWQNLRLVLAHATDVYIRLNIHQSPFNVGVPVSLPDFTPAQADAFANTFQLQASAATLAPLLEWVGGHPYLLQLAFSDVMHKPSGALATLLTDIATEAGIYGAHLRELLLNLAQEADLAKALEQVVTAADPVKLDAIAAYKLQSMGLITLSGNLAESRCRLYQTYFSERLPDIIRP